MFDRTDALHLYAAGVDQQDSANEPMSAEDIRAFVAGFSANSDRAPAEACGVRVALIDAISEFTPAWTNLAEMSTWLAAATSDLEYSVGSMRLSHRRAFRIAEEARQLLVDALTRDDVNSHELDLTALLSCEPITHQVNALKVHKALKRIVRLQRVHGWKLLAIEQTLSAIGCARLTARTPASAVALGKLVQLVDAIQPDGEAGSQRLRLRLVTLERELAAMADDTSLRVAA